MARSLKKTHRPTVDMAEIAPNRFLIHNPRIEAFIKGEGILEGRLFELTSWRREGMIARLRGRNFNVRTLADLLAALPEPPAPPPITTPAWRALSSPIEQISHFNLRQFCWQPLTPQIRDDQSGVTIYAGWVLRRRKGRNPAAYYIAFTERSGGIGLRPLSESQAILIGYAQAMEFDDRPWLVEQRGDQLLLPDVDLPPEYRTILDSFSNNSAEGPLIHQNIWPLAQDLFARLGVRLTLANH